MDKFREFLVIGVKGIYNTRAFTWPHQMMDRDWIPDLKRKQQEQIHVIEYSAYEQAQKRIQELEDKNESLKNLLYPILDYGHDPENLETAVLGDSIVSVLIQEHKDFKEKIKTLEAKIDAVNDAYQHLAFLDKEYDKEYVDDVYRRTHIRHALSLLKDALKPLENKND